MLASRAERRIHAILSERGVPFKEEVAFKGLVASSGRPLLFDFAVMTPNGNSLLFLLEMNGKQHYVPVDRFGGYSGLSKQRHNDAEKRRFCRENGIRLVVIPYYEEERLSFDYIMDKAGVSKEVRNGYSEGKG